MRVFRSHFVCRKSQSLLAVGAVAFWLAFAPEAESAAKKPTRDLCFKAVVDRYLWVNGLSSWEDLSTLESYRKAKSIYKRQEGRQKPSRTEGPWKKGLVPVYEAQVGALYDGIALLRDADLTGLNDIERFLHAPQPKSFPSPEPMRTGVETPKPRLEDLIESSVDKSMGTSPADRLKISAACAQMSLLKTAACVSAVRTLVGDIGYKRNIILPQLWAEFVASHSLQDGLRRAALQMLERMRQERIHSPSTVFEDLLEGFRRSGFSPEDAEEAAWKMMALYSNGGHSAAFHLQAYEVPPENGKAIVALHIFSQAVTLLDYRQRFQGLPHYAFPSSIRGSCLSPKPYHFWLSAYLSRSLIQRGYSADVAAMAAFIAAKAYHIHRDVGNGRASSIESLLSRPANHPSHQVVRMDLVLAAAGSWVGALGSRVREKSIHLSAGLEHLESKSGGSQPIRFPDEDAISAVSKLRAIQSWDRLFNPNAVFDYFRSVTH